MPLLTHLQFRRHARPVFKIAQMRNWFIYVNKKLNSNESALKYAAFDMLAPTCCVSGCTSMRPETDQG